MLESYTDFFEDVTGHEAPYPYQRRLGTESFPDLLDVPTGLGKTAAVAVAWMYKRLTEPEITPMRLVYCLPMRVLVDQTHEAIGEWAGRAQAKFEAEGRTAPSVNRLMGGDKELDWVERPEDPAVVVGTQDMLVSRALMRGYGESRYEWPVHYGLLHNDALWVYDETQLMGASVPTSAQLAAFRDDLGTGGPSHSIWMSATLDDEKLETVDHDEPEGGWSVERLNAADRDIGAVRRRLDASKRVERAEATIPNSTASGRIRSYVSDLAEQVSEAHGAHDGFTLVVMNRVNRARELYEELADRDGLGRDPLLVHSRFRREERDELEEKLERASDDGEDRVAVATQVVEAGVDLDSRCMITELAPWSSLVQRAGRCNRAGGFDDARLIVVDAETGEKAARPYEPEELESARRALEDVGDFAPANLEDVSVEATDSIYHVLRRRDAVELFDTSPDLGGNDLDVKRFVRDVDETDVLVYWRDWEKPGDAPPDETTLPGPNEICRVPCFGKNGIRQLLDDGFSAWRWDPLAEQWEPAEEPLPGQTLLIHVDEGGYDADLGWTGDPGDGEITVHPEGGGPPDPYGGNDSTDVGDWVELEDHLGHVVEAAEELADDLADRIDLPAAELDARDLLLRAAAWHDIGKAHDAFQRMLKKPTDAEEGPEPPENPEELFAKSNHRESRHGRDYFRHELASALAILDEPTEHGFDSGREQNLLAYLVAAHHGKVRLSIRSLPQEEPPEGEPDRLVARGIYDGETLRPVPIPGVDANFEEEGAELDLSLMELGQGSWLERMLELRDDPDLGPFRLSFLEALVRIADRRASEREKSE